MTIERVPVSGGSMAVEILHGPSEPILVVHGVSSQRRLWGWLHTEAPHLTLVAPDLRGRGDSVNISGPSSLAQHADDLRAVVDALGLDAVHVCGMSMGAFVAVEFAARHASRVKSLVLVDGGVPVGPPAGLTRENVAAVFMDRMARTRQRWNDIDDYVDYLVSTSLPLLDRTDPLLREYAEHDLLDGSVRLSSEAVVADATDVFFGDSRFRDITVPVRFLHAQWSIGADSAPMYSPRDIEALDVTSVESMVGLDHAGTIMTSTGARAVSAMIDTAVKGG
ncbi:alpha/beta hydrolase [Rhodococcus sp. Leaf7]|uniref:alpha/beta fold hydrolase n=1 Tax=unclassified Rhodococcus (in: high G+C Gram-positive bacteria) TaxID=192944 RepID=UPI0006FA88B9|nr:MULTISPECIES: alpha/beta hydrolase [unclassified Rhodococcus (in: high G+C Gram-positive bacteria)]KQU02400.1 alpha/beta hydrolase [Rhodococcus sp. Leaf7]KQU37871.1 alpha/beta hydrolase [Rhodococcus sp. Leaf247]